MRELKKLLDDMISTLRVTLKRNEHRGKKEGWLRIWSPGQDTGRIREPQKK